MARLVERSKSARASMTCQRGAGEAMSPGLVGSLPQTLSQEEPQGKSGAGAGAWPDVLPDWDLLPWHPYSCRHVVARLLQRARGWERSPSGCPSTRCPWGGLAQPTHPSWGAGSPALAAVGSLRLHMPAGSAPLPPGGPAAMPGPAGPQGSRSRQGPPACTEKAC